MLTTESIPVGLLTLIIGLLLVGGCSLLLPLYGFSIKRLVAAPIFIKVIFWLPIYMFFLGTLYANNQIRLGLLLLLIVFCWTEIARQSRRKKHAFLSQFSAIMAIGLLSFIPLTLHYHPAANILIIVCMATVLSDVCAYFCGTYLGHTTLPAILNNHKSWEGVVGQIIGAAIGVLLVHFTLFHDAPLWLCVPIGVGSAMGDLLNSYAKRRNNLKDWSGAIPGHGGFTDRLSSSAGSAFLSACALLLF